MTETDPVAERPRVHVGLTGGIAAGKSAVARVLQERGALLVDSDALARLVLEKGTDGLAAVQDEFGDRVITADGELDRVEMARIVFGDEGARQRLNRIVHPGSGLRPGASSPRPGRTPSWSRTCRCWWRPGRRTRSTS